MATTFQTIWTAVMNRIRMPVTNTAELVKVKQIVNDVYRDICMQEDWYWLIKRHVFNTASAYDAGTITVTEGSTAFTLSDTPTTGLGSFVGRKLMVSAGTQDSLAVQRIATHTAAAATGLLDLEYTNPSSSTAGYHVYQDEYDLPTDFVSLVDFERYGYQLPARPIGPQDMLALKGNTTAVGKPQAYTVLDYDTTGTPTTQRQLWVHPYPDKAYRTEVYYRRQATEMISAEDEPAMPENGRQAIIHGALEACFSVMLADDTRSQIWGRKYVEDVNRLATQHREKTGQKSRIAPLDSHRSWFKGRRVAPGSADLGGWFDRGSR